MKLSRSLTRTGPASPSGLRPLDTEDRWGSHAGYDMIRLLRYRALHCRSQLEAVQRLVLTATSTRVEVSSCETEKKAEAMGREPETE
ncbi:unnamed protein product [Ectocarpus sp. 8 AP-2014]